MDSSLQLQYQRVCVREREANLRNTKLLEDIAKLRNILSSSRDTRSRHLTQLKVQYESYMESSYSDWIALVRHPSLYQAHPSKPPLAPPPQAPGQEGTTLPHPFLYTNETHPPVLATETRPTLRQPDPLISSSSSTLSLSSLTPSTHSIQDTPLGISSLNPPQNTLPVTPMSRGGLAPPLLVAELEDGLDDVWEVEEGGREAVKVGEEGGMEVGEKGYVEEREMVEVGEKGGVEVKMEEMGEEGGMEKELPGLLGDTQDLTAGSQSNNHTHSIPTPEQAHSHSNVPSNINYHIPEAELDHSNSSLHLHAGTSSISSLSRSAEISSGHATPQHDLVTSELPHHKLVTSGPSSSPHQTLTSSSEPYSSDTEPIQQPLTPNSPLPFSGSDDPLPETPAYLSLARSYGKSDDYDDDSDGDSSEDSGVAKLEMELLHVVEEREGSEEENRKLPPSLLQSSEHGHGSHSNEEEGEGEESSVVDDLSLIYIPSGMEQNTPEHRSNNASLKRRLGLMSSSDDDDDTDQSEASKPPLIPVHEEEEDFDFSS